MKTAADYAIAQAQRKAAATVLQQANPHLVPAGNNSLVAAAKNIRTELKAAFPGVKFSVKSKSYSGGDSINVSWIDGPTAKQVETIADKYSAGSFDGMTDCYDYAQSAWTDAFGDAKFVFCNREYSDRVVGSVLARVARYWAATTHDGSVIVPSVTLYRKGQLWSIKANCQDFASQVHQALAKHTCCVGA